MKREQWDQIEKLCQGALDRADGDRASFLDDACAGDDALRREVESLLKYQIPARNFIEAPALEVAAKVAAADQVSSLVGEQINRYQILSLLGAGGMGTVYLAEDTSLSRRVALKIINPGMDSNQVIARFETERQALAMMDHPNIARVFDAGATSTGRSYFVMELVDGIPITHYCDSKRLSVAERIRLFIPVCQAIQHAHQKGIIHRDIKPSNILVAEQEGKPSPKVIDFGLAKALGHQLGDASMMTNLGIVVGTPDYMSPEQAELTRQDIDTRSDIYSSGAVLYELLTSTTPLKQERLSNAGYIEVLRRIREEEPLSPSVRLRSQHGRAAKLLRGELDWITMKALEKDRTRRYETVDGLARDLQRYLDGEPVEAGPPSATYRMRRFAQKHRAWLATGTAFAALLIAGAVTTSWMAIRASHAEQEALAVNEFLQNDLLAQASANTQARPDTKPDADLKVRTALDRAAARIDGKFAAQPLVEASIRQTIGRTYKDLGLYAEAQRQVERTLELRRRVLGEQHPGTLASMDSLGGIYGVQGNYAQAEPLFTKVLEIRRRVLGEEHPNTLSSINRMGSLYRSQHKDAQAEPLFTKVLEIQQRLLGEEHPDTLLSMSNLGEAYGSQGKNAQAEPLFIKVLEIRRRVLGEEHPDTLRSMNDLGVLYLSQGKDAQAEPLFIKVLEIRRRVLGEEHPDTLRSMSRLGEVREKLQTRKAAVSSQAR
jgi:non-specific serine/threonine protein kinase/serine/threonine-protein kinase